MNERARTAAAARRSWLAHAVASTCVGLLLVVLLYSDLYERCCNDANWLQALLLPGMLLGMLLGGGIHDAGVISIAVGVVLQVVTMWLLVRYAYLSLAGRKG
jgi:hypothetical protein